MITRAVLDKCHELGVREGLPLVWLRLGLACVKVSRALPTVEPGADLLDRVAVFRGSFEEVEAMIDEWITVHDQMRRTRLRSRTRPLRAKGAN